MGFLPETLRQQAEEETVDLNELIGRAALLASVLRQKAVRVWLKQELQGYEPDVQVPSYRTGTDGTLVAMRPGAGWIEAPVTDAVARAAGAYELREGVPEILRDYAKIQKTGGQQLQLSEARQRELKALARLDAEMSLAVPSSAYERVLETVRIGIGLWAAELSARGVVGEGAVFSITEREAAAPVAEQLPQLIAQAAEQAAQQVAATPSQTLWSRLFGKAS